jgi:uncharacterized protein YfaS (alpha-2-macroglobulin family)
VTLSWHETGPQIRSSSAGLVVSRRWSRLVVTPGPDGDAAVRTPVEETVPAGTLVESEVTVTTDRPREYVMVVDPHLGGFEPAEPPVAAPDAADHREAYDDRTVWFAARLPAGTHVFRRTMRATFTGNFVGLPAQASLMYFPDVRGTSGGEMLEVSAAPAGAGR